MAWKVRSGITITRNVSGSVKAIREANGTVGVTCLKYEDPNFSCGGNSPQNYGQLAKHHDVDAGVWVHLFDAQGIGLFSLNVETRRVSGLWVNEAPDTCPAMCAAGDEFQVRIQHRFGLYRYGGAEFEEDPTDKLYPEVGEPAPYDVVGEYTRLHHEWSTVNSPDLPITEVYNGPYPDETCSWDKSTEFTIELSSTFDLWAQYFYSDAGEYLIGPQDTLWKEFAQRDPIGLRPRGIVYYLKPATGSTIALSVSGAGYSYSDEFAWSGFGEDAGINGFGAVKLTARANGLMSAGTLLEADSFAEAKDIISATITGIQGQSTGVFTCDLTNTDPAQPAENKVAFAEWDPGANTYRLNVTSLRQGGAEAKHTLMLECGVRQVNYSGCIRDMDGSPRAGIKINFDECEPDWTEPPTEPNVDATTDANGEYSRSVIYPGWVGSTPDWTDGLEQCRLWKYNGQNPSEGSSGMATWLRRSTSHSVLGLDDPEPAFQSVNGDGGYNDGLMECELADLAFEDAVELTILAELDPIVFGAGGWSHTGDCTVTSDGGYVKVTDITSESSITKTLTGNPAGMRFADFDFDTDDTEPITLSFGGRSWQISGSHKRVDALAAGSGSQQTLLAKDSTPQPDWGFPSSVGSVTISGLRVGKTYTFRTLTPKMADPTNNPAKVIVFGEGSFIGSTPGEDRLVDEYTCWESDTDVYSGRQAIVLVDGVIAAEIYATHKYMSGSNWVVDGVSLGDAMIGATNAVSKAVGTPTADTWEEDALTPHLRPGIYTAVAGVVTIPARMRALRVWWPWAMAEALNLQADKYLQGLYLVRVANTAGAVGVRKVYIAGTEYSTDAYGTLISPGFAQPDDGEANSREIKVRDGEGNWVTDTLPTRNRNWTLSTLAASAPVSAPAKGLASTRSHRTNRAYMVYSTPE